MASITESNITPAVSTGICPLGATIADLLSVLGDLPEDRVIVNPAPGTATEQDVVESKLNYGKLCELVDGVLVEKPVGFYESTIAGILFSLIHDYLRTHNLGLISGESGPLRLLPGNVRMPDVSFVSWDRFPDGVPPKGQVMPVAPTLAIEVLSPGNTKGEMDRKLRDYFSAGVKLVWYIDPVKRIASIYHDPEQCSVVDASGELLGDPVLPGLRIALGGVFADAFRNPPPAEP